MLSNFEKETILRIDEESKIWTAYTSSKYYMRRFENAKWKCIKEYKDKYGNIVAKEYTAPRKQISILRERPKRIYSDEELEALRNRMKKMREKRFFVNSRDKSEKE